MATRRRGREMLMKYAFRILSLVGVFAVMATGCIDAQKLNPLSENKKTNTVPKNPTVTAVNMQADRITITGSDLDDVTVVRVTGNGQDSTFSISSQSSTSIVALAIQALTVQALQSYSLVISTAAGQTIIPITFQINNNTITSNMIIDDEVDTFDIKDNTIKLEDFSDMGAANAGDYMTWDDITNSWVISAAPTGGGGGGGVTSLTLGNGIKLSGGSSTITSTGSIVVDAGSGPDEILQLDSAGDLNMGGFIKVDRNASTTTGDGTLILDDAANGTEEFHLVNENGVFYLTDETGVTTGKYISIDDGTSTMTFDTDALNAITVENGVTVAIEDVLTLGNGSPFSFPTTDGANGEVLTTDGAGTLTWQSTAGTGTVTQVTAGTGLSCSGVNCVGNDITTDGTLNIDVGTNNGDIVQVGVGNVIATSVIPTGISATNISAAGTVDDNEYTTLNNLYANINGLPGAYTEIYAWITGEYQLLLDVTADNVLSNEGTGTQVLDDTGNFREVLDATADNTLANEGAGNSYLSDDGNFVTIGNYTYAALPAVPTGIPPETETPVSVDTAIALKQQIAAIPATNEPINGISADIGAAPGATAFQMIRWDGANWGYETFRSILDSNSEDATATTTTVIGNGAGAALDGATLLNVLIGVNSGAAMNGASTGNVFIGHSSGDGITTGANNNTAVGYLSLSATSTQDSNTAIGASALSASTSGANNTVVGASALDQATSGSDNVVLGNNAMGGIVAGGDDNVVIGGNAGSGAAFSGSGNVIIGKDAGSGAANAGSNNIIIGEGAGPAITSGGSNILIGNTSGQSLLTNTNAIMIGNGVGVNGVAINSFFTVDNDNDNFSPFFVDIGNNKTYIGYDMTDLTASGGGDYALYVGTDIGTSDGLYVDSDSTDKQGATTSWTTVSDGRFKEVHGPYEKGLNEILKLNIVRYNYKKETGRKLKSDKEYQGIVAQEVRDVFPEAVYRDNEGYYRFVIDPLHWASMKAIQDLFKIVESNKSLFDNMKNGLDERVTELERRVSSLEEENAQLKSYLCAKDLEAPFCK